MQAIRFVVWILAMAFAIANMLVQLSGSSAASVSWNKMVEGEMEQVGYLAGVVVCLMFAVIPGMTLTWAFAGALMAAAEYPLIGGLMILVGVTSMFTHRPATRTQTMPTEPAARRNTPITAMSPVATTKAMTPALPPMPTGRGRWRNPGRRGYASREAWRTTVDGATGSLPSETTAASD